MGYRVIRSGYVSATEHATCFAGFRLIGPSNEKENSSYRVDIEYAGFNVSVLRRSYDSAKSTFKEMDDIDTVRDLARIAKKAINEDCDIDEWARSTLSMIIDDAAYHAVE